MMIRVKLLFVFCSGKKGNHSNNFKGQTFNAEIFCIVALNVLTNYKLETFSFPHLRRIIPLVSNNCWIMLFSPCIVGQADYSLRITSNVPPSSKSERISTWSMLKLRLTGFSLSKAGSGHVLYVCRGILTHETRGLIRQNRISFCCLFLSVM